MPESIEDIASTFRSVDSELRLDLLLDYANKLPELPERFHDARDAGLGRIEECMTPVFVFVEVDDSGVARLFVDVAEEAPTVKGFLSIVVHAYDGKAADEVIAAPDDLLKQLGLDALIRMNRVLGLAASLSRIKNAVIKAKEGDGHVTPA